MPDKLKAHSNERIDLVDFILAANDYTSSTNAFDKERTWLDGRSRILEGFYVEISDQTTAPGQITIYNGTGLDRDGNTLNDESLANSATTVTLAGASQSFYIEIELTSSDSSTDSRAFWDPTVTNTVPIPNGGEVNINVPTRITPNWQVVYPVSTSGFSVTTNPASTRVPIALLNTNGSNQITNAVNTYGSLVNASTKAETDVVVTAGSVRVIDSKLFAVGSQFTYDFGGANPEVTLTVTGNDLDNNIISFTPGLSFAHNAGAILRQTGVTARFLPQTLDPNDPTFSAALPTGRPNDQERRMFQGDETRGSAFLTSKSTYGARNDLDIRTLKDEVDFLAAMVRDMKFGHPRADVTSDAPPSSFSTRPRYFDDVGGIAGARTAYVTIGNGTTTFGDFNGTDQTPFIAAENALPANGGTIYVKPGTYIFTAAWVPIEGTNVSVVGDGRKSTSLVNNNASEAITIAGGASINFSNLTIVTGTGSPNVVTVSGATVSFSNCEIDGIVGTSFAAVIGDRTDFNRPITATSLEDCVFTRCNFTTNSNIAGTFVNCLFDSCEWTCTTTAFTISGVSSNVRISNSSFVNTTTDTTVFSATNEVTNLRISNSNFVGRNTGSTTSCVSLASVIDASFLGCTFTGDFTGVTSSSALVRLDGAATNTLFDHCVFAEASLGTGAIGLGRSGSSDNSIVVQNCDFTGCQGTGIRVESCVAEGGSLSVVNSLFTTANRSNFNGIYIIDFAPKVSIDGCYFDSADVGPSTLYGVRVSSAATPASVYVTNCTFKDANTNGTSYPVAISSSSINSLLSVTDSTFTTGGNVIGGTGVYRGIFVTGATAVVSNNTFTYLTATGTSTIACIYNNSNPSDVKLTVSNNIFSRLITANGTLRAVDVLYGNTDDSVSITNNTVHDVTTASSAPSGLFNITHTVSADATHKLVFSGNTITDCQLGTGGFCYAIRCFYGGATITNNTFSLLTAPGSTSLAAIGAGQCASLIVADNVVTGLSSTNNVYGISIFNGSPISVITSNKVSALTSTAAVAAGMSVGGVFTGECCSNDFSLLSGNTLTHSIVAAGFSSAVVANNSCSSLASGAVQEISANSCSNTVFSNNKLSHTSSTTAYGIAVTSSSIDGMSILGNVITGYRYPVNATTASSASITGNINISGNTIDSKTLLIPNFVGVYVGIDVSGLNGIFRGIAISNNIIRKSDSTSSSCIIVDSLGVASTTRVTGISVTNNQLFETGSNVTSTGYMIRLAGTVAGGVIAFQDVAVNNNNILCIGALGTRQPAVTFAGCTRATMNNNTVLWNSGAQDTLHFAVVFGTCVGNMVESNTSTYAFDASGGSGTTLVGNTTNLTSGVGAIQNAFTNVASNL